MIPHKYYNPTPKPVDIRDLNIKVKTGEIVNVEKHRIAPLRLERSYLTGDIAMLILDGKLEPVWNEQVHKDKPKYEVSKKPIPSRVFCVVKPPQDESSFIDEIESQWLSNPLANTEAENARIAEKLINSEDLEDFEEVPFKDHQK